MVALKLTVRIKYKDKDNNKYINITDYNYVQGHSMIQCFIKIAHYISHLKQYTNVTNVKLLECKAFT